MYLKSTVEGTTEPMYHRLYNKGVPMLIQNMTLQLLMEGSDCSQVATAGKTENLDDGTEANRGLVKFTPLAGDLHAELSPYYVRWLVTDGGGKTAPWPSASPARLRVYSQGNPMCAA